VLFAWILFRSPDLPYAIGYIGSLLRPGGGLTLDVAFALDPLAAIALLIGAASVVLPRDWVTGVRLERNTTPGTRLLRLAAVGAVFPASIVFLIAAGFSPFLYFRF
jgi:alginate O-acetyltransferase complex protein AlgI